MNDASYDALLRRIALHPVRCPVFMLAPSWPGLVSRPSTQRLAYTDGSPQERPRFMGYCVLDGSIGMLEMTTVQLRAFSTAVVVDLACAHPEIRSSSIPNVQGIPGAWAGSTSRRSGLTYSVISDSGVGVRWGGGNGGIIEFCIKISGSSGTEVTLLPTSACSNNFRYGAAWPAFSSKFSFCTRFLNVQCLYFPSFYNSPVGSLLHWPPTFPPAPRIQ